MRASLAAFLLLLVSACGQAPVQPAPARTAPAANETSPYPVPPPPATPPPAPATVAPPVQAPPPSGPPPVQEVPVDKNHREVLIHTNLGDIVVQLDAVHAPITARHFMTYVKEHYYDGSAFYRVIPGFVIQAGDYTAGLDYRAPRHKPIPFESTTLSNLRGSVAMAHGDNPNSANAAFFINLQDNIQQLAPFDGNPGYAVFGQVVKGMDVVDKIAALDTHTVMVLNAVAPYNDVPVKPAKLLKVTLLPMKPSGKH